MKNNKKYRLIIVLFLFTLLQVGLFNTIISLSAQENSASEVIGDGTYFIKSAINEKYVLDIEGASTSDLANVELFEYNGQANQQFKIKHVGNGYYQITAVHSNKVLDVEGCKKENETNIEQFSENIPLTSNQKWKIKKNTDGTYSFISECNGLYLDVYQAKAQNKVNIQVYEGHDGIGQKFKLESINNNSDNTNTPETKKTIENGTYTIKSAINDRYVLDITEASTKDLANLELYESNRQPNQQFNVEYLNDGTYQITAVHSGKVLDVEGNEQKNGTNVEQYTLNNPITKNQKWIINKNEDETYSIISECNGLYLDVNNGKATNGANIQVYQKKSGLEQKFKFEEVTSTTNPETNTGTGPSIDQGSSGGEEEGQENQIVSNGIYSIASGISDNFVLDVKGGSKADCANIQVYEKQAVNREKFKLEYLGDGTYKITSVNSNKVLDVQNDGRVNETNVCQFTPNNPISDNEKWIIKDAGGGYYYIISKASGLYLDIYNAEAKNGANVQIYEGHEGIGQKFKFVQPLDLLSSIDTNKYPGYKEKIKTLMDAHPAWNFELLYTGLKFDDVIAGETSLHSRNLVPNNYGGEWICQVCGTKLYDSGWYCASR